MEATTPTPAAPFRLAFSLRTLLIVIGGISLLLAPIHWFGWRYVICAAFSLTLVLVCAQAYRSSPGLAALFAICGVVGGFPIVFLFPVFFLHAFFNAVVCAVLIPCSPRPRTLAIALLCVMMAVYALKFYRALEKLGELQALRAQFPIESLSNRLLFEQDSNGHTMTIAAPNQLSATVEANLQRQEKETQERGRFHRRDSRALALEELYENSYPEFAEAAGLEMMFKFSIRYRLKNTEPHDSLKLPAPLGRVGPLASNGELYEEVHRIALDDFTSPERMGFVKSRDAVAGYEPHRFDLLTTRWRYGYDSPKYWQITRFEFVRVLGEQQRVYVADVRPTVEIPEVPHWPLNEFEMRALPQLATQTDVVIDSQPDQIKMLGAIRAGKSCLKCHAGERGKLLGAFSYEIAPISRAVEKNTAPE